MTKIGLRVLAFAMLAFLIFLATNGILRTSGTGSDIIRYAAKLLVFMVSVAVVAGLLLYGRALTAVYKLRKIFPACDVFLVRNDEDALGAIISAKTGHATSKRYIRAFAAMLTSEGISLWSSPTHDPIVRIPKNEVHSIDTTEHHLSYLDVLAIKVTTSAAQHENEYLFVLAAERSLGIFPIRRSRVKNAAIKFEDVLINSRS